jgi:integrase
MKWEELNGDTWTIPAARTKGKSSVMLPLSPLAMQIIANVPRRVGRDYLFGERAAGFTNWTLGKADLDARLGPMKFWRVHDLRRSSATHLGNLGTQPHVIECILGHRSGFRAGVSGTYNRSPYFNDMRSALAMWADYVGTLVEGSERKIMRLLKTV